MTHELSPMNLERAKLGFSAVDRQVHKRKVESERRDDDRKRSTSEFHVVEKRKNESLNKRKSWIDNLNNGRCRHLLSRCVN